MMIRFVVMVIIALSSTAAIAEGVARISQNELDQVMDNRVLLYHHPRDARKAIESLVSRGASTEMLNASFSKILWRDMNSPVEGVGLARAHAAIHWLNVYGGSDVATNFLEVASVATNALAETAWRHFSKRSEDRMTVIIAAERLLARPGMENLHSYVWDDLDREAKGEHKAKVEEIARKFVVGNGGNAYRADLVLCTMHPKYEESDQHLKLVRRLTDDRTFSKQYPMAHQKMMKQDPKEEK